MLRRPSIRASVTTVAAAAILVGGASLASYAATGNALGHGAHTASKASSSSARAASVPKTIKYHLGAPGRTFAGNSIHLLTANVPKGNYQLSMSGFLTDATFSGDSYTCLIADKKTILHVLTNPGANPNISRLYALTGDDQNSFSFGALDNTNPAQNVDRRTIAYGCLFNGTGPYTVQRTLTFTLTPVNVTNKSGSPIVVAKSAKSDADKLAGLLR